MAGKVLNKMMGMLGFEDDYEDELEEENYEDEVEDIEPLNINNRGKNTGKIVNIHTASTAKVVIIKPLNFDEVADICDNLKNRKIVLVNTTKLESRVAQRLLDFMGGASYALGGTLQEVEKGVYILSPSNIEVTNDLKTELTGKGMFNWNK